MPRGDDHTLQRDYAGARVVSVGPQDPDAASQLVERLGTHNKAGALLRRHAASFPPALTRILQLPKDEERSATVLEHLDEVRDAALSARGRHQFFREGDELVTASVRHDPATGERFVAVLYSKPSGRNARGALSYDSVPAVERAHEERRRQGRHRIGDQAAGYGLGPDAPRPDADVDPEAAAQADELRSALEAAEAREREREAELQELREQVASVQDPEPWPGYGETAPNAIVAEIRKEGVSLHGRAGLERVVAYEESRQSPRKSIVEAAKDALAEAESAAIE